MSVELVDGGMRVISRCVSPMQAIVGGRIAGISVASWLNGIGRMPNKIAGVDAEHRSAFSFSLSHRSRVLVKRRVRSALLSFDVRAEDQWGLVCLS